MNFSSKTFISFSVFILFSFFSIGQNSEATIKNSSTNKTSNNYSKLNGFWIGKIKHTQLGRCKYRNNSINTNKALFKIDFTDNTNPKIIEYTYSQPFDQYMEHANSTVSWRGKILNEGKLNLVKNNTAICSEKKRSYKTSFSGKIYKDKKNMYTLSFNGDEEWCPGMDCKFNVEYNLTPTDSIFSNIVIIKKR